MNVLKKLQNPFALVVQGFVVGGVLFWTTQGQAAQPRRRAGADRWRHLRQLTP